MKFKLFGTLFVVVILIGLYVLTRAVSTSTEGEAPAESSEYQQ
jgi:hypothetical protein